VKLVHLVGFITRKFVTMHGHVNVKWLFNVRIASLRKKNLTERYSTKKYFLFQKLILLDDV